MPLGAGGNVRVDGVRWGQRQRDQQKRISCGEHGVTLIEIPYWWDLEMLSLLATIHKFRKDLVPEAPVGIDPIPEKPPRGFGGDRCSQMMHGEDWDGKQDLTGWFLILLC